MENKMIVVIDAGRLTNKTQSHAYLKELFQFPEYYGNNLDAFHDCLEEMTDVEIQIENEEDAGAYFRYVKRVIEELQ